MNGRFKYLLGGKSIEVFVGQMWIRKPDVSKINNPLNIEIIALPDEDDERFYVMDVNHNSYMFFFRDDIINNYEEKLYRGEMDLNEQIYEILGGRHFIDKMGQRLYPKPIKETAFERAGLIPRAPQKEDPNAIPDYVNNPKLADILLHGLEKYNPKLKVRMGKYTVYLDKPYSATTREEAICKAWIAKNI